VLLVLAVLTGVVAMHGLGPVLTVAHQRTMAHSPVAAPHPEPSCATHAHAEPTGPADADRTERDPEHGGSGGHIEHADDTCAASGIAVAPMAPALARTVTAVAPAASPPAAGGPRHPHGPGPPSLSTLQLLRI
jgi:hypothetical protein